VLIACCLAALLAASPDAAAAPAAEADAIAAGQAPAAPAKAKKAKKKKKVPKETMPAPDELPSDEPTSDEPTPQGGAVEQPAGVRFMWRQHPSIRLGSAVRIDFHAKLQEHGQSSYDGAVASAGLATWELHRNRIGLSGYVSKDIEYEVEYEFTENELTDRDITLGYTPKQQWKDVNVNLTYVRNAQIQIGRFKIPFGLDELTSVTHNDFIFRSMGGIYLAPGRDVGLMAHGSFLKHGLTYATGAFAHDGDHARSKKIAGGDTTFAGRVTARPLQLLGVKAPGVAEVGAAFAASALSDDAFRPNGLRGRTIVTQDTFYEPVYVKGHRRRFEADVDWTVGRAALRAEYTHVSDDRLSQGIGDQDLPDALAHSWYLTGTWVVTGEDKQRPLKAAEPLLQGGIGAIEVAARFERIWFGGIAGADIPFRNPRAETIFPEANRALTLGVNWTLNRFVKIQVNGVREHVEDPERNPVSNGAFWSRVLRLQFVL
jgi:phosphate-selective porin OprO and OprP